MCIRDSPYLVVGWDVLRKALKGIKNRQPFDAKEVVARIKAVLRRCTTTTAPVSYTHLDVYKRQGRKGIYRRYPTDRQ